MSFTSLARTYLQNLSASLIDAQDTGEATAELSYRSSLDVFLREVFTSIYATSAVILEPKRRPTGAPDFRVHDSATLGVFGFIEAKGPELRAVLGSSFLERHKSQIERYKSLGYRVMVTDGLDFWLLDPDQSEPELASLVNKPVQASDLAQAPINPELYPLFAKFLAQPTFRILSEQGLVDLAAKHAREIARVVAELTPLQASAAVDEAERKTIERLHAVHQAVSQHLDPHLKSADSFGGFVAQVLAFSLLYAHRVEHATATNAQDLYNRLVSWGTPHRNESDQLRPFRELIRLLGDELKPGSSGDLGRIYDTLRTTLAYISLPPRYAESPEYHTLYEAFLERFDSSLRERYGAYYTPRSVADGCVKLTLHATKFKGTKRNKIVEPCCGTGSFVDALQAAGIQSPITGLEVLPSAYALACFRQSMVQDSSAAVQIVLTNTMADDLLADEIVMASGQLSLFEMERSEARFAIRPPVVLVIGNPPAKDVSTSDPSFCKRIYELIDDFRPSTTARTARANDQKQTTSTAMQFLRWSAERVLRNGEGALSLLLPSSFINKPSYKTARRWLKEHFGQIWILEIDGDARAGAQSNIFPVQQGRSLVIAQISEKRELRYADITGLKSAQKIAWLSESSEDCLGKFALLSSDLSDDALSPTAAKREDWDRMVPLWQKAGERSVFVHQCSGIKLAPTSIFVNLRQSILKRRVLDLRSFSANIQEYVEKWFRGQAKPPAVAKLSPLVQRLMLTAAEQEASYKRYALRPFLNCCALISEGVLKALASQPNSGTRYRPEHLLIFADSTNIAIGVTPAPDDVSALLGRPCVLLRHLPDNDLSRRGNIRVLAARSPGNKRRTGWGDLASNLHRSVLDAYESVSPILGLPLEEAVVLYSYAVLSTQWFLDEWEGQLMECTGDQLPRVPLPLDPELFIRLAQLGVELDSVERESSDFALELGTFKSFRLGSHKVVESGNLILIDEQGVSQWEIEGFGPFKDFETGGYNVLTEMIKWMSGKYLRADVSKEEVAMLYSLRKTLLKHSELQPALEDAVRAAVAAPQLQFH